MANSLVIVAKIKIVIRDAYRTADQFSVGTMGGTLGFVLGVVQGVVQISSFKYLCIITKLIYSLLYMTDHSCMGRL